MTGYRLEENSYPEITSNTKFKSNTHTPTRKWAEDTEELLPRRTFGWGWVHGTASSITGHHGDADYSHSEI